MADGLDDEATGATGLRDGGAGRGDLGPAPVATLDTLLAAGLDPLFRLGAGDKRDAFLSPHAPFIAWFVQASRPRAVLVVGPQASASCAVVADAMRQAVIPGRCVALRARGEPGRTGAAAGATFGVDPVAEICDENGPLPFGAGEVDLLVVSLAAADAVGPAVDRWRPLLSTRAAALFTGAGRSVSARSICFFHGGGLTLVACGPDEPDIVRALCDLAAEGGPPLFRLRSRFAALGALQERQRLGDREDAAVAERLELRHRLVDALLRASRQQSELRALAARADAQAGRQARIARLETALADMQRDRDGLRETMATLGREAEARMRTEATLRAELETVRRDLALRAEGGVLRRLARALAGPVAERSAERAAVPAPAVAHDPLPEAAIPKAAIPVAISATEAAETEAEADKNPAPVRAIRSVLFVAGEPDQVGATVRAERQAASCAAPGRVARWARIEAVGPDTIDGVDMLVLWRAAWSPHVETMIGLCRAAGAVIVFDVDDLVVDPGLARVEFIDGLRFAATDEAALAAYFAGFRRTAQEADLCIGTTEELARALRVLDRPALVVPNGFDDAQQDRAAQAVRAAALTEPDRTTIRIGYAAGTRTHQRDFAVAAAALGRLFALRPEVRLVLFRDADGRGTLLAEEFDALAPHGDRIEWRETVPLESLPDEIARFDIAICPLETGNPFCEAKSELKYVEAALAAVPLVASPTGPFARAIVHGRNGMLARDEAEWFEALRALVDDPGLRRRLGQAAHADALWRHGPRRRRELWDGILRRFEDGETAAREADRAIRHASDPRAPAPVLPDTDTVFEHDDLGIAAVAVAVTSYNYAAFILEALDSVAAQTMDALELVVVDDCSTDNSVGLIVDWARAHAGRFRRLRIERTRRNSGLGPTRNAAFAAASARHVMSLDADNTLRPSCCEALLALLLREDTAFAYSTIPQFGDMSYAISARPYDPARFVAGNYIDAMALVAKWAWAAAGGYYDNPDARGWEDFDLWCRLVEFGQRGVWHPEPLCDYRVHAGSMTNAVTERDGNKRALVAYLEARHPWLHLGSRVSALR